MGSATEQPSLVQALAPQTLRLRITERVTEIYRVVRSLGELPLCLIIFLPRVALSYFTILYAHLCCLCLCPSAALGLQSPGAFSRSHLRRPRQRPAPQECSSLQHCAFMLTGFRAAPNTSVAQFLRNIARLMNTTSSYEKKANLRILIITDYTPPQTHGIAIRFQHYITNMRRAGHEVQVYSTNLSRERLTSFDHPNMPSIVNPFNTSNCMAYNPGLRLAWVLGAKQWDIVHLVFPSVIGSAIIPVCNWRRIPIYCSHHVDMEYYVEQYAKSIAWLGNFFYWLFAKLPARYANANAAPTLCFLDSHIPHKAKGCMRVRIPSGVADERFKVDSDAQLAAERRDLERICGGSPDDCICIMVQRLAPEKDTMHALEALLQLRDGSETLAAAKAGKGKAIASASDRPFCTIDGKRKLRFVIAGDGPARKSLVNFTEKYKLPVTFTGNVKNDRLPPLYRAADVFVTCSTSETYGLTVLEALACGTPSILPHCAVFDELWEQRLPKEWMYDHGNPTTLLDSLKAAANKSSKQRLRDEPVKASWSDATTELLEQYDACIDANLPLRMELATIGKVLTNLFRVTLVGLVIWWALRFEGRVFMRTAIALLQQLSEDPTSISR